MKDFTVSRLPTIEFGKGKFSKLIPAITRFGNRLLIVTGKHSFQKTLHWSKLQAALVTNNIDWQHLVIADEPSPMQIDEAVKHYSDREFDVVVAIGGGSPLDAAKAIAGLLKVKRSVMDYLEGVGPELDYSGPSVPFIAVPTTAGTGSEATKNAVLSRHGVDGFKKSFRDERLVAQLAIVDPDLLASCPAEIIAANGMDALTQLIESFISLKANTFTDSLALGAIEDVRDSLVPWYKKGSSATVEHSKMAYAALISGITLAQVGLGSVHGVASPLGAFYTIPHGAVCGTLLASATRINISAMQKREPDNPALEKYATLSIVLHNEGFKSHEEAIRRLPVLLENWTEQLNLEPLGSYGVDKNDLDRIVSNARGSSMKTNPIVLTDSEIKQILLARL